MKWLTKKFSNLFIQDNEEELYIDENEVEQKKDDVDDNKQHLNDSKTSFRFPIVKEEEPKKQQQRGIDISHQQREHEGFFDQMEQMQSASRRNRPDPQVYEVQQAGIRDLLANRGRQVKTERVIRSQRVDTFQTPPVHRSARTSEQVLSEHKEEIPLAPQNKRRFTPTNVPSPVYGFANPSEIGSLLAKKREDEEQSSTEPKEDIVHPAEIKNDAQDIRNYVNDNSSVIVEQQSTNKVTMSIISQEISTIENNEDLYVKVEIEEVAENIAEVPPIVSVEVEKDEGNFNEEQLTPEIDVPETSEIEVQVETQATQPIREKSRLPFNVMMLQSDKAKLEAKVASKPFPVVTKIDVSGYQELAASTVTEEVPPVNTIRVEPVEQQIKESLNHTIAIQETSSVVAVEDLPVQPVIPPVIITNATEPQAVPVNDTTHSIEIYTKPSIDLLEPPEEKTQDIEWMESQAAKLVEALSYFQVTANIESILQGPAVTQFEITMSQGTKVSKIRNLADDLKLALAAKDIRIQAPIPGKSSIGIEIPNRKSRAVRLSEVTASEAFLQSDSPLEAALGLDLTGKPVTIDLRKMPHGLIAGATGSGKSVCINSIIVSLLYKASPHELKLMLIDPKMVELAPFNHIPHLVSPVITDVKAATAALKWAVEEMERRYQLFAETGVRDLTRFNKLADSKGQHGLKLPYILIVIDELADLMMMSPADVEEAICRIAQKARACGIHLIVATQRPSVDVITGLIKSNIPTRIAFAVSSQIDSRTIIDSQGAERLLGRGDMLYLGNGMSDAVRIQGTFVTDDEIETIIEHVREQGKPEYFFDQEELLRKTEISEEQDDLFEEVCRFVYEQGSISTSLIQRKYHVGFNRAARLVDMLEKNGFVSEQRGSKARDVFITESDLASLFD